VFLRALIDPFGKHVLSKSDKLLEYLKLEKRKLLVEPYSHAKIIIWEVGKAKVPI
jgi:hypothetical protein